MSEVFTSVRLAPILRVLLTGKRVAGIGSPGSGDVPLREPDGI